MAVDSRWFRDRIAASPHGSQRQLAFAIGITPAAMTLVLQGKRALQLKEAEALARELSQPLEEVLARAGVRSARKADPFPNMPKDIQATLAREPKGSALWPAIRAIVKLGK